MPKPLPSPTRDGLAGSPPDRGDSATGPERAVALTVILLGAPPLFGAGFVTFRPNRLLAGEAWNLWTATGTGPASLLLAGWALLAGAVVLRGRDSLRGWVLGILPCLLLWAQLVLAGTVASRVAAEFGPIARVSLGTGFWVPLLALPLLIADTFRRHRRLRVGLAVAAAAAAAAVFTLFASGALSDLSLLKEYANRRDRFLDELGAHLLLSGTSVALAVAIGLPLGLLVHRRPRLQGATFFTLNTLQTIPSLALFGILIPVLAGLVARFPVLTELGVRGIGTAPALIALTVYALLPVARNTHAGFRSVPAAAVDAGHGMGMTAAQLLWRVELPIASPVILNGVRIALVQAIGLTAVAALIGAGGFGVFIFQGLGQAATDLILLGAVPTVCIALLTDAAVNGLIHAAKPKGLR